MIDQYGNEITWIPTMKTVKDASKQPMYKVIASSIEKDIQSGVLLHGIKLPPQRVIANHLGINHGTVTRAYQLCEEKGLLKGITGKGTFVSGSAGLPVELLTDHDESHIISLGMTLPLYSMNTMLERTIKDLASSIDYNIALKYCPPEGHLKHRYIAANWLRKFKVETTPSNIVISSGTQNALAVILTTMFSKSDRIIVDELTYTGLKSLAKYLGIILVPVRSDAKGMDVDILEATCRRENIKGIYLMPDCHNPTAQVMPEIRRKAIARIIQDNELLLIEDGTYSFILEEKLKPLSMYVKDRSFYIHGTSKAMSPTFRISYIIAGEKHAHRLRQGINNLTWMASPYTAEILSLLQATGQYDEIVNCKLQILKQRNKVFDDVFATRQSYPSTTSMFRYLELPMGLSEQDVEQKALAKGVQVFGVGRFHAGIEQHTTGIRLSISSPLDEDELKKGLTIIRDLLENSEDDVAIF